MPLPAYLSLGGFSGGFFEEGGPGREKVLLRVLLQAAVAAAHRAVPRHWPGKGHIQPPTPHKTRAASASTGSGESSSFQSARPSPSRGVRHSAGMPQT